MSDETPRARLGDYVRALERRTRSVDQITECVAMVGTANWSLRHRVALAWKIVRR